MSLEQEMPNNDKWICIANAVKQKQVLKTSSVLDFTWIVQNVGKINIFAYIVTSQEGAPDEDLGGTGEDASRRCDFQENGN